MTTLIKNIETNEITAIDCEILENSVFTDENLKINESDGDWDLEGTTETINWWESFVSEYEDAQEKIDEVFEDASSEDQEYYHSLMNGAELEDQPATMMKWLEDRK